MIIYPFIWSSVGGGGGGGSFLPLSGGTMTGNIVLAGNAVSPLNPVTLQQFSGAINGLDPKNTVTAATNGALPANTYNNGASGVGATLTGNANGALTAQDGITLTASQSLLVWNEGNAQHNGIYEVTQVGSAGTPYILTRRADMDNGNEADGAIVPILSGVLYGNKGFLQYNPSTTIGASNLAFTVYNNNTVNDDGITTLLSSGVLSVRTGGISNAQVNAAAAIAYSKLNISNSIVNADVNNSAAIAYSKLDLVDSIVNADINAAAAIEYGKLDLAGSIQNSDIDSAAGINFTKLEATNPNSIPIFDGSGFLQSRSAGGDLIMCTDSLGAPSVLSITTTEAYYACVGAAAPGVQNQLLGKEPSITAGTTLEYFRGDKTFVTLNTAVVPELTNLYFTNARARSAISGTAPVLYNNISGAISMAAADAGTSGYLSNSDWSVFNNKVTNPMSAIGDIIYNDGSLNPEALAIGTLGQVLTVNGGLPSWETPLAAITDLTGDITASGPGSVAATLATVNAGVGSFTRANITVNAKGLITAAASAGAVNLASEVTGILPIANGGSGVSSLAAGSIISDGSVLSSKARQSLRVSVTETNNTVTPASISAMTSTSLGTGNYRFYGNIIFRSAATTTGIGFRVNPVTATMSLVYGAFNVAQAASGVSHYFQYDQLTTATNVVSASVIAANTDAVSYFTGTFTLTGAGTVAMKFRSEIAASQVSVMPGSYMIIEEI